MCCEWQRGFISGACSPFCNVPAPRWSPRFFCSQGGGLRIASGGEAHLSECTVSGNEADYVRARLSVTFHRPVGVLAFCSQGGGLYIDTGGEAFLTSCTISGNQADYVSACLSTFETLLLSPRWRYSLSALS